MPSSRQWRTGPVTAPPPGYQLSRHAWLPLNMVHPDPENARKDLGDLTDLIASMREVGLIAPIEVRATPEDPDREYVITAGHRRYASAEILGWEAIESIIRRPMPPVDVLERMVAENGPREPLPPLDEAAAFRAIFHERKYGRIEQLAHRVGRSVSYVSGRLALLDLPPAEQQRLRAGDTTIGDAVQVAREVAGRARPQPPAKKKVTRTPPPAVPGGVRGAVARALDGEADALRSLAADRSGPVRDVLMDAASRIEDRAGQIQRGEIPIP